MKLLSLPLLLLLLVLPLLPPLLASLLMLTATYRQWVAP